MDNRYPVPDGFRQLLEALAREVLRGQPKDIYAFSALFFTVLLEFRNELDGTNPLQKRELYDKFKRRLFAAAIQESLVSPTVLSSLPPGKANQDAKKDNEESKEVSYQGHAQTIKKSSSYQPDDEDSRNRAATKIQSNIRGYLTRKRYKAGTLRPAQRRQPKRPTTLEDKAASKIQAGVRGYLTRKQLTSAGIPVKSPTSSQSPRSPISGGESGSPRSPMSDPDTAAAKIQAGVRGYLARKHLAAKGVPVLSPTRHSHGHHVSVSPDPGADKAASKIQAGVRGYLTRKHLEGTRKSQEPPGNRIETRRVTIANVDDAATKIQAGIRGYLTRKHLEAQGLKVRSGGATPASSTSPMSPRGFVPGQHNHLGDDGIQSPGDDEAGAATKIQAAFRGHKVRQQYGKHGGNNDFGGNQDYGGNNGEFM